MILLSGKAPALDIKQELLAYGKTHQWSEKYVGIVFLGENPSSATYVRMKQKFGRDVGLEMRVYGQAEHPLTTTSEIMSCIDELNADDACLGILVQLPLPDRYAGERAAILSRVAPHKDIDGLGGRAFGLATIGVFDFLPATPAAVMGLLAYYQLDDVVGKTVVILGQSDLIGKPLATALMTRGATVVSCNVDSDPEFVRETCKQSDYIISCTGVVHLIDKNYVREDKSQVVVDVGRGIKDGKAVGDVAFDEIAESVKAVTPVPGGVGPMTIANLFRNVMVLGEEKRKKFL